MGALPRIGTSKGVRIAGSSALGARHASADRDVLLVDRRFSVRFCGVPL